MSLVVDPCVVYGNNTYAMTLVVDPCVVCGNNTHAMTLVVNPCVVCGNNTHAKTVIDPLVVYGKEHTCNDHWLIHMWFVERTHMQ